MRPRFGVVVRHALHAAVHDCSHLWKRQAGLSDARGEHHLALPLVVAVVLLSKSVRELGLGLVAVEVAYSYIPVHLGQIALHHLVQLMHFVDPWTKDEHVALGVLVEGVVRLGSGHPERGAALRPLPWNFSLSATRYS